MCVRHLKHTDLALIIRGKAILPVWMLRLAIRTGAVDIVPISRASRKCPTEHSSRMLGGAWYTSFI
jgi:hypothetical protein